MGLRAGGNYLRYLIILVIFMVSEGANRWEDVLKSQFGVARQVTKGGDQFFMGKGVLTIEHCYFETLLYLLLGAVKEFTEYLFSLYYYCFTCFVSIEI